MIVTIISYNISKSIYLQQIMEKYLEQKQNRIVFFQEIPQAKTSIANINIHTPTTTGPFNGTAVFCTKDLSNVCTDVDNGSSYSILKTPYGKLVNVHMPGTLEGVRDENAIVSYSKIVNEIRLLSELKIVGGDFNANPFDGLMGKPAGWAAKRSTKEKPSNVRYFLNPFWNLLRIRNNAEPRGSLGGNKHHTKVISRSLFDQFLIDESLKKKIISFGIIKKIGRKTIEELSKIAKDKVKPDNDFKFEGTFHYPVYITLRLEV